MISTNLKEHLTLFLRTPVEVSYFKGMVSIWICNEKIKESFKDTDKIPASPKPNGFIESVFEDCVAIQTSLHTRDIIPFASISFISEYYYHTDWKDLVESNKK